MHPNSVHLLVPPPLYCAPMKESKASKQTKAKTKRKNSINQNKTKVTHRKISASPSFLLLHHLFIQPDGIRGFSVSYIIPFCPMNLTGKCSLQ